MYCNPHCDKRMAVVQHDSQGFDSLASRPSGVRMGDSKRSGGGRGTGSPRRREIEGEEAREGKWARRESMIGRAESSRPVLG